MMQRIEHPERRLSTMWITILITFIFALCGQATTVLAQATNTFPTSGNVGIGTTTPGDKLVVYGSNIKSIFGDSTVHTNLYSTYNTQSWSALEIFSNGGTAAGLVVSNNVTSGAIGGITFANKGAGVEGTNDLRLGGFFLYTDGAANSGYLNFWTASGGTFAERMRITSGGNVGIGTAAPWSKLSVAGAIGTTGNVVQTAGAARGDWGIYSDGNPYIYSTFSFGKQTTTSNAPSDIVTWNFQYSLAASGLGADRNFGLVGWRKDGGYTAPMYFQENGNVIFNQYGTVNGNVGIGNANPAYKLDVNGIINATAIYQNGVPLSGGGATQWTPSGSDIYYNSGKVGIGTTTPQSKLQVGTLTSTSTAAPDSLSLGGTYSNSAAQHLKLRLYDDGTYVYGFGVSVSQQDYFVPLSSSSHVFYAGASPLLTIKGTGQVGIGTTAPGAPLHVAGGELRLESTSPYYSFFSGGVRRGYIQSDNGLYFNLVAETAGSQMRFFTANTERIRIDASGNVGFGTTTPAYKLDVSGQIRSSTGGYVFPDGTVQTTAATGTGGSSQWTTSGANIYYSAGSVGIGTIPAPQYKLDVAGDVRVSGNIAAKYQDVAEWVEAAHLMPAGTVVVLNPARSNQVMASEKSYDTRVAGVVSERPGLALGEAGTDKVLVATTGRVKVKVDASRAPIHIGDLLVTSDVEGVAMKSEPLMIQGRPFHSPGTLIGKALEPLEKGTGEILVLLSLQ